MSQRVSRRGRVVLAVVLAAVLGAGAGAGVMLYAAGNGAVRGTQLGALAWYSNNYASGGAPTGVLFDGTSVWVADASRNTVSKINPATGAVLGAYTLPAASSPYGIAFDGSNIWAANNNSSTVSKVSAATGAVIGTYALPAGSRPIGVVFDGTSIWTANNSGSSVSKINPATGAVLGTYVLPLGSSPRSIAFDGTNIWTANEGTSAVSKINPSTGAVIGTYPLPADSRPVGIVLDQPGYSTNTARALDKSTYMWTVNNYGTVSTISVATGAVIATYPVGVSPFGIAFDGTNIWVTNYVSATVTKIQAR